MWLFNYCRSLRVLCPLKVIYIIINANVLLLKIQGFRLAMVGMVASYATRLRFVLFTPHRLVFNGLYHNLRSYTLPTKNILLLLA